MRIARETRKCPVEFQDRVTRMFGTNEFGDPLFRIAWGQTETIRLGTTWRDKHGNERAGYRDCYLQGSPCWCILQWKSPKTFGHPDLYYIQNFDESSGLSTCGEYPYRGRYIVLQPLVNKEFIDGKLVLTHFPLSHVLIDRIIPLIMIAHSMTKEEQRACRQYAEEQEHKQTVAEIADRMADASPIYGPVSYSRQGIRTSLLDRKMEQIQRGWNFYAKRTRGRLPRGFFQSNTTPMALSGSRAN